MRRQAKKREQNRARRGLLATMVGALLAVSLATAAPAAAQFDDDGLRVVADAVYRVLPNDGAVEVEISYAVTNQVADQRRGFEIIQTFFRSIVEIIPDAAVDVKATRDNGDALSITPADIPAEDAEAAAASPYGVWEVDLGPNLFYQQTRRLTVSFRLPDGAPRTPDAWARINPAFASFPASARGDSGLSSLRVEFPPGYVVESFGNEMERSDPFGATVLSADGITDPLDFFIVVFGSSESGLNSRPVEVDGIDGDLIISSWPGDDEWDSFVERGLVEGIPFLADEIGVDWPVEGELEVIETVAPALAGYGGWFYEPLGSDGSDAAIDVGEELLFDLLGHEIAHAWFNSDFTRMRWLNEGLAEHFGLRMATEFEVSDINEFDPVTTSSEGAVDLIDWRAPSFLAEEEDPTEAFGYAASYQLISELAEEIGADGLEAALVALFDQENPYRPTLTDPGQARVDWRDLLDALELVGGSELAEALLIDWVLGEDEEEELEGRSAAQTAVAEIADQAPGWATPDALPRLLADWDFDDAEEMVAEMSLILDDAQLLLDDAALRGLAVPEEPQESYEAVERLRRDAFDETRDGIARQRSALDRVLAAYDRSEEPTSFFENVGLYGTDVDAVVADAHAAFEAGDYDAAVAFADDVDLLRDDAENDGQTRVAIAAAAIVGFLLLVLLLVLLLRRRRRRRNAGEPEAETELSAEPEAEAETESGLFAAFPEPSTDDAEPPPSEDEE